MSTQWISLTSNKQLTNMALHISRSLNDHEKQLLMFIASSLPIVDSVTLTFHPEKIHDFIVLVAQKSNMSGKVDPVRMTNHLLNLN